MSDQVLSPPRNEEPRPDHSAGLAIPRPPTPVRIVLAKIGLDGHDRGLKVVARGLRDSGFQVIYEGIWQSPAAAAQTVADEDAHWLGISLLNGAHMTLVPRLLAELRLRGLDDVGVVLGGTIPAGDAGKLREMGVARVFGPGTSIPEIARFLEPASHEFNGNLSIEHTLIDRVARKDQRALARLLTLLAYERQVSCGWETLGVADSQERGRRSGSRAQVTIALTGSAGVGKSSVIAGLLKWLRAQGLSAAVLACDPQSSLTGGALLGDRLRMGGLLPDASVFIRSLAVPGGSQGLHPHLDLMVKALKLAGFDVVLIETSGVGQGDTAVADVADRVVLVLQPETGDWVQWGKAGLLEVADLVVLNKADLPGAASTEAGLRDQLGLPGSRGIPVVAVSAVRNEGILELWARAQGA